MPLNITTENPHYALLESEQPYGPSYGVQYLTPTGHFMQVEDISCDRIFVEKMVELFNLCELPPERLYRIILPWWRGSTALQTGAKSVPPSGALLALVSVRVSFAADTRRRQEIWG